MSGLVVHCGGYWKDKQFIGPISFACCLTNKVKEIYSELSERIYHRIGVSSDRFELKISSQLKTENRGFTLSISTDDDVTCVLTHKQSDWPDVHVEVVDKSVPAAATENVFRTPTKATHTTINVVCTPSPFKPSDQQFSAGTPHYKSVSGSNNPLGSMPSPVFTSTGSVQGTPASTNKQAKVDDRDVCETANRGDEYGISDYTSDDLKEFPKVAQCDGKAATGDGEAATGAGQEPWASGAANSSIPSMASRWTIPGSELYSIQPVESKDFFEDQDQGPIYKGQIFKDKKTLKQDLGMYALIERFELKVKRSTKIRFAATCRNSNCEWVIRAGKLKNGTYWHVKSFVKEHTCTNGDNYNMQFSRVSSSVIGELFAKKLSDPGCNIRPKDIITEVREQHGINLKYNRAYRSKNHALNTAFGDPWESFKRLPEFFYMLEQSNPGTVTKIDTDSENRFAYGFMSLGASIAGFNEVIRPVIAIDATHLKSKTRGVLLVAACKDGNEKIYPLAFGFANSECTESWTWFLSQLRNVIVDPKRVMIVSDRHTGIIGGMATIFPDAAHGFCAYHLAQNLRKMCKQRDDVIKLYYRATYTYCIEEFEREMAELKDTHRKCYDNLLEIGIEKISRVRSPKRRYKMMTTNIAESMNSCLLAIRKLPIASIAEFIRDLLQRWFHDRRTNAHEMSSYLTRYADYHIKQRVLQSQRCEVHPIDCNRFKVNDKWIDTIVDLEQHSCSCRQWDLDELPCIHVMAVARLKGMPINALCSDFYTTGWLKHAYSMPVNPVPKPETWNIPDEIRDRIVLPWKKKRLTGRPKNSRTPSAGEFRKQKQCSNCGDKGHNKRSCPNPSSSSRKPVKKTRACIICKKEGHNRLKCPDKEPNTSSNDTDDEIIDR